MLKTDLVPSECPPWLPAASWKSEKQPQFSPSEPINQAWEGLAKPWGEAAKPKEGEDAEREGEGLGREKQ